MELIITDLAFASKLAKDFAALIKLPLIVYYEGPLGIGKTTFIRKLINYLGFNGKVSSPSYALMQSYPINNGIVWHLDCYRLSSASELEFCGIRDLLAEEPLLLIEWPSQGSQILPQPDLLWQFSWHNNGLTRNLNISARSTLGKEILSCLALNYPKY